MASVARDGPAAGSPPVIDSVFIVPIPATRHNYRAQAARYDETRGASPSILRPLIRAIEGAPRSRLVDVAGGTGNYARAMKDRGWKPMVVDVSIEMLMRARGKGLPVVRADAARLPLGDGSVDAVMNVSALHLIRAWKAALADSTRVLRRGGRLGIMLYAREHLEVHWILEYFPTARRWAETEHQTLAQVIAELPGAEVEPFEFGDLVDASMAALCRQPELLLDHKWRLQTSFFERLESADPRGARDGLERLTRDLAAGRRPDEEVAPLRARLGDGAIVRWRKP
jgi:ubiquinone/menaquinone biosynthesis C-methylase UbiE